MARISNLTYVTVTGTYKDLDGNHIDGSVLFTAATVLLDPGVSTVVIPKSYSVNLDGNGHFSIDLPATNDPDLSPVGWTYQVREIFAGGRSYPIGIPWNTPGGTVDISTLAPAAASSGMAQFVLLADFNAFVAAGGALIGIDTDGVPYLVL